MNSLGKSMRVCFLLPLAAGLAAIAVGGRVSQAQAKPESASDWIVDGRKYTARLKVIMLSKYIS